MKRLFFSILLLVPCYMVSDDYFEVLKHGVLYRFVKGAANINDFVRHNFGNWEQETFEVFQKVKDENAIAIDLGAWIGTTAIWLSKNFAHVVAVDGDYVSLDYLIKNLQASECYNVSICKKPVAHTSDTVIFGSHFTELNESVSYIKTVSDKTHDYKIQSITLDQLLHDFIYTIPTLKDKKIAFIKCDIEGGEEDIMEDLLKFAYHNKVKVFLSFHHDWWQKKKITDFTYLFKFFKIDCPMNDICEYIQKNPFGSVLLEPLTDADGQMIV